MRAVPSPNTQYPNAPPQFPMEANDYGIGVALGSPTMTPLPGQDPSRVPRTMTTITSPAAAAAAVSEQPQQPKSTGLSRQISKRIPFLGRSKSRRINANNGGVNYSRPSTDANYIAGSPTPSTPSPSVPNASCANYNLVRPDAAKLKKPKSVAMRSVTDPQMQSAKGGLQQPTAAAWKPGQNPVLDVEIPDIRLERYSVMFSSLIEKQQAASSLLARRQATLARIRAVEEESRREHHAELQRSRRATSPSMPSARTPVAELPGDPAPDDSAPGINIAPLRLRSNTFPMVAREAEALSPLPPHPEDQVDSPGTSIFSPVSQFSPARDSDGRPSLHSKFHKPSVESISSPYFRPAAAERENATALSPPPGPSTRHHHLLPDSGGDGSNVSSPAYTPKVLVAKQIDIPSRSTSLRNPRRLTPASAAAAVVSTPPPRPNPKPASKEEALEDAAEVSIARQISISRGQRRFLEPLHERERRRARANQHIKAASQISLDDGNKRLAETKTATPVVVHPENAGGGHLQSPRQHMYRRSEQVTIEGA